MLSRLCVRIHGIKKHGFTVFPSSWVSFPMTSTHPPARTSSFYSLLSDTRNVFVPESPQRDDDNMVWQPGQSLPLSPRPAEHSSDVLSMLQSMQNAIYSTFEEVKKQDLLENHLPGAVSSSGESPSSDHQRKRRSPSELQVNFFSIYFQP